MIGVSLQVTPGPIGGGKTSGAPPVADDLNTSLAALEAAGKLVSAWFLPLNDPDQYLTTESDGTNSRVTSWAAAYGSQKVDLLATTGSANRPVWDATLYGGKGGVTANGTNQSLTNTGSVTSWPDASSDLFILMAGRHDGSTGTVRLGLCYGSLTGTSFRNVGVATTQNAFASTTGPVNALGSADAFPQSSSHTLLGHFDIGGNLTVYLDGASAASLSLTSSTLSPQRARMFGNPGGTSLWSGAIVGGAVLNATATLSDALDLEALMRARLS